MDGDSLQDVWNELTLKETDRIRTTLSTGKLIPKTGQEHNREVNNFHRETYWWLCENEQVL